jgi:hypothetical protein
MYNYIKNSGGLLSQLSSQYSDFNGYTIPTIGTDLNSITSGVTNNNSTDNSNYAPVNMNVNIVNQKGAEAITEQKLEKMMTKITNKRISRFGGRL